MLRKSPTRTEAFLAANRRNALKSTGPRTPKARPTSLSILSSRAGRPDGYRRSWRPPGITRFAIPRRGPEAERSATKATEGNIRLNSRLRRKRENQSHGSYH